MSRKMNDKNKNMDYTKNKNNRELIEMSNKEKTKL